MFLERTSPFLHLAIQHSLALTIRSRVQIKWWFARRKKFPNLYICLLATCCAS
ncbi:hypothetical protein C8R44DRAFT_809850 [Mycena epipterygia]|nr:hypothetical protein C8R44DRAFT_809850 [Mycena epipterygia]